MIYFERVTEDTLENVLEIINSNSTYNTLENGISSRTMDEIRNQFLNKTTDSFLITVDHQQIGLIDFLKNNPKDNCPWLGLLMIHGDFHSKGYGKTIYQAFEEQFIRDEISKVRIGIIQENEQAKRFWTSLGFCVYGQSQWNGKTVDCLEQISKKESMGLE
ncbi:GNAT family N-acetyltransferase [Lederbergia citri]|uniref:GNAT family N-acetyltransferase n=1 Tax=Lederbergia citri TaxID=2833580 RepID=A0A942TG68_9BACI|nr:GNAT family N-acetyltransferase [Lederbergia citri]MBS4197370.1 GNAT family N-acetyltransferase [Lederbergia citri]